MSTATEDVKTIRDLLGEPGSTPKAAAKKAEPAPLLDEHGCLVEPASMRLASVPSAPAARPALDGLPDPEADNAVIELRANHARLAADLRSVIVARAALEVELGLPAGANLKRVEQVAVELLLSGKSDEEVEKLKALAAREARLASACQIAAARIHEVVALARRKLTAEALERVHKPAARAVALKALELLAAMDALRQANDLLERAGHARPAGLFADLDSQTQGQNTTVAYLEHLGLLTRAEVAAALPELA